MDNGQVYYQLKPGYCIRDFCGESLVIPIGGAAIAEQQMAILSSVGRFLWDRLQNEQTFENLLLAVLDEYEVTQEEAKADIKEFLTELNTHKYLNEERK